MKSIFRTLIAVLLLGGWTLSAAALHVIRTPDTFVLLPKDRLGFVDTYADTRGWTLQQVAEHPALFRRLVDAHRADAVAHVAAGKTGPALDDAVREALIAAPVTPGVTPPATGETGEPSPIKPTPGKPISHLPPPKLNR